MSILNPFKNGGVISLMIYSHPCENTTNSIYRKFRSVQLCRGATCSTPENHLLEFILLANGLRFSQQTMYLLKSI